MRNKGDGAEEKRLVSKQIVSVVGDCDAAFCSILLDFPVKLDHSLMAYLRCVLHVGNSFVRIICSKFCAPFGMIKMKTKNCIGLNTNIVWQMGD